MTEQQKCTQPILEAFSSSEPPEGILEVLPAITSLDVAEKALMALILVEKRRWTAIFTILDTVHRQEFWRVGYHSFSAWLTSLAVNKLKIHVSTLWKMYTSGRMYQQYACTHSAAPTLEKSSLSYEQLDFIAKVAGTNSVYRAELIHKLETGQISTKELKAIHYARKAQRQAATINSGKNAASQPDMKLDPIRTNRHQCDIGDTEKGIISQRILAALINRPEVWIPNQIEKPHIPSKARVLPEFAVPAGDRNIRSMSALVLENYAADNAYEIVLHCIEIRVTPSDLEGGINFAGFASFCDHFWVAVPEQLAEMAMGNVDGACGILVMKEDGSIVVIQRSVRNTQAGLRHITMAHALQLMII